MKTTTLMSHLRRFDIMPLVHFMVGLLLFVGGTIGWAAIISESRISYDWLGAFNLLVGGLFLMGMGLRKHRGEWPTLIGTLLIILAGFGLGWDLDGLARGEGPDLSATLVLVSLVFLCGLLLLLSGQRMHQLSSMTPATQPPEHEQ